MNNHAGDSRPTRWVTPFAPFSLVSVTVEGQISCMTAEAEQLFAKPISHVHELISPSSFAKLKEERRSGYQELELLPVWRGSISGALAVWKQDFTDGILLILSTSSFASSAASREEVLSTAAHDLKNPIGALFGYADSLLETKAGEGLNERQREVLTRMRSTSARAIELVRNYQQLADFAAGKKSAKTGTSELNSTIKTVLENTWCEDPKKYQLSTVLSREPLKVAIDKVQLDRALSNLLSNAYRYTPSGGTITLRSELNGEIVRFSITNSAPVISEKDLPNLFKPHFRAQTSQGTSGTGLGLYIVKNIVEATGGKVSVTSAEAVGTTFTLEFPLAHVAA